MKKTLKRTDQLLKQHAVSLEEIMRDISDEQKRIIESEIRKYDLLVELRRHRKKMGLTQAEFAARADLPRTTITKIESGNHNPTISTLMQLAHAMNKRLELRFI